MGKERCIFCKCDPYHYVHNGIRFEPVAIICCDAAVALWDGDKRLRKIADLLTSKNPHKVGKGRQRLAKWRNEHER